MSLFCAQSLQHVRGHSDAYPSYNHAQMMEAYCVFSNLLVKGYSNILTIGTISRGGSTKVVPELVLMTTFVCSEYDEFLHSTLSPVY